MKQKILLSLLLLSTLSLVGCKQTGNVAQQTPATIETEASVMETETASIETEAGKIETQLAGIDTEAEITETIESTVEITGLDYNNLENWAYSGTETDRDVDIFFVAPTNVMGDMDHLTADLENEDEKSAILASIGMQTGIYNETGRFFAPYYRQITLAAYALGESASESYLEGAYEDVKSAFEWYLENRNEGRPFIIAGFSQGAEHGLRLMKEYMADPDLADRLVAAYLIGWRVTEKDLQEAPYLKMAGNETDTGVIVTFECEAEDIDDTLIVPNGVFTYSINPLNWRTDSTPGTKEENLGCVFPAADGSVTTEIPNLCGGYLDAERGTLKITDVAREDYPARIDIFPEGSYHIYDYLFFYRNLQQNVKVRTEAYLSQ